MDSEMERRGSAQHGHRLGTGFDDDLDARADAGHQAGEVASFRDMDRCHTQDHISLGFFEVWAPGLTGLAAEFG